jgi:glycosyl transferase family 25
MASSAKVWVISLANDAPRRETFATNAPPPEIDWAFFDAHSGLQGNLTYDERACMRNLMRPLRAGELGCFSSHVALWKWLVDSDVQQMVVLEDDVVVDWPFLATLLARDLPSVGVEYLRLFAKVPFRWRYIATPFVDNYHHLVRITGSAVGTQGYLITKVGARRMLAQASQVLWPVDMYMDSVWQHGVMNLAIYPFPLYERFQPSSIGDARLGIGPGFRALTFRMRRKLRLWRSVYGPEPLAARLLKRRLR